MKITVKLFAYFRDNRFVEEEREYPSDTSVSDIITELGINLEEVGVTMINSKHCSLETIPTDGDSLGIFPMIGGG